NRIVNGDQFTSKNLFDMIEGIKDRAHRGDTLVLSFIGHGIRDSQGDLYLATSATDPTDIKATAISWKSLIYELKDSDLRVFIFLDATQISTSTSTVGALNDSFLYSVVDGAKANINILTATKGRQYALPQSNRGGLFIDALARALTKPESDTNQNGAVEMSELYRFIKSDLDQKSKGRQTPWIGRNRNMGDFSLF
ncbi:MAG: caspase family protein, partial [Verrucomicrobiota bacterium]